jgi:hypothetical protein
MKLSKILNISLLLLLCSLLIFSVTACRGTTPPVEEPTEVEEVEEEEEVVSEDATYKIGIMTGTVSQGEEEYQEAINQMPNMVTSSCMPPILTNSPQKWKRPSREPLKWHRILRSRRLSSYRLYQALLLRLTRCTKPARIWSLSLAFPVRIRRLSPAKRTSSCRSMKSPWAAPSLS